ncbi:cytochrome c biogenesis protein CcdA [Arthrobacter cheniae]|uniref:Cytochrome c biogenesis protein CcdA n=1 Tax=Arthrobacter cheniae TaxID=1258888 RepID=A0A3A5M0A1_9MICC|nr:cytochrome c biogenesis CcdA family protein [Arthrobacter cheniae]RJT76917.1 cytochrome c biogenesis protein CcdA [Arthrobacter cheniae]
MMIGYAGAFIGGILTLLSPCSALLLPAFFAYAFTTKTRLIGRTVLFYAGLLCTLVPLGVFAGTLGSLVTADRPVLIAVSASVVIVLGVVQILGLRVPAFIRPKARSGSTGMSVFILGMAYGVAGACTGPILGSILTIAAAGSNAMYGGILLAVYALGMAVPLFLLALIWDRLGISGRRWLRPRPLTIGSWSNSGVMVVSGLLSIGIGIMLLVTDGTAGLGGILTVTDQFQLEATVRSLTSQIPNTVVALVTTAVLIVAATVYLLKTQKRTRADDPTITHDPGTHTPQQEKDGNR